MYLTTVLRILRLSSLHDSSSASSTAPFASFSLLTAALSRVATSSGQGSLMYCSHHLESTVGKWGSSNQGKEPAGAGQEQTGAGASKGRSEQGQERVGAGASRSSSEQGKELVGAGACRGRS